MSYTVVWLPQALTALADIWVSAHDQTAVTAASAAIDRELQTDPEKKGRATNGFRVFTHFPLSVLYYVAPSVRHVWIRDVVIRQGGSSSQTNNSGTT